MGYDTMASWDRTFTFNGDVQQRSGVWQEDSATGRTIVRDECKPSIPTELPAHVPSPTISPAPSFRNATSSWSPPHSPSTRSRSSTSFSTPTFQNATASWSPPPSPSTHSRRVTFSQSPPNSPKADSAITLPTLTPLKPQERNALASKLYAAACAGDLEHMRLLIHLGAPVDAGTAVEGLFETFLPAKAGRLSPLAGAAGYHQLSAVKFLLAAGAALHPHVSSSSNSPLHQALRADDAETVLFLLEQGADVNATNSYKSTPLMYAVKYASPSLVRLLLSHRPHLEAKSFIGAPALHWSLWPGFAELTEILLQAGADVHSTQNNELTGLHIAVMAGHVETVRVMLRYGADPEMRDAEGKTVLDVAEEAGNEEVWRVLQRAVERQR